MLMHIRKPLVCGSKSFIIWRRDIKCDSAIYSMHPAVGTGVSGGGGSIANGMYIAGGEVLQKLGKRVSRISCLEN